MKNREVRKVFVVDTSLLLHDPKAILSFEDNIVIVPFRVLEELDAHKSRGENGTAYAARQVIRILDGLREKGRIYRGVETPGGGIILTDAEGFANGSKLDVSTVDNFIISVAMKWKYRQEWMKKKQGAVRRGEEEDIVVEMSRRFTLGEVVLVTKDVNLRVKADACRISAQDYLRDRAVSSEEQLYKGVAHIRVHSGCFRDMSRFLCQQNGQQNGLAAAKDISVFVDLPPLFPNQCCIFEDPDQDRSVPAIYKAGASDEKPARFIHVPKPKKSGSKGGIEPRNMEQAFALALLMDPEIQIVTFSGIAGSGKTLMALLAGLKQVVDTKRYEEILVYRSNTEIGNPLGFLKGTAKQKFSPWTQPIYDILELLALGGELELFEVNKNKPLYEIDKLLSDGIINISPINFVQGRSFHYKFVVVDETQNFRPGDMKKVITRVGKGTKIVLTGDVAQIENPFLDALTNGLSHVIERMKGLPLFAHLSLEKSERSELAELAAKRL